jgi:hypothetical protein
MRRFFTIAVFVWLAGLPAAVFPVAAADTGPEGFVRTLGSEALHVIRADMPPAQSRRFFTNC